MRDDRKPRHSRPNDDAGFIGDKAEQMVRVDWCRRNDIVTNKAGDEDKCGWDLHLEVPVRPAPSRSAEQQPGPRVAYVQVKGTRAIDGMPYRDIRLDHWRTSIHRQSPFFFVFIQFDDDAMATAAYLTHVDEHWIAKGLESIRAAEAAQGPDVKLSKRTLRLRPQETDALSEPYHESFVKALRCHMAGSDAEYGQRKRELVERLGFEAFRIRGKVSVAMTRDNDQLLRDITDWALGRSQTFVFDAITAEEVRFGIPIPIIPNNNGYRAEVSFDASYVGTPVTLVARAPGFPPSPPLPAKLRTNANPLIEIPRDKLALRISSTFLDIQMDSGSSSVNVNIPEWTVPVPLDVLAAEANFLVSAARPGATIRVDVENTGVLAEINATAEIDAPLARALETAIAASDVFSHFHLAPFPLSLGELHRLHDRIILISHAIGRVASRSSIPRPGDGIQVRIAESTRDDDGPSAASLVGNTCGLVMVAALPLRTDVLVVWIAAVGPAVAEREEAVLNLTPRVFDHWVGPRTALQDENVHAGVRRAREEMELAIPDICIIDIGKGDCDHPSK